jgi:hypothetical protein
MLLRQRITTVQLVMEGDLGKDAAAIQSVSTYVSVFNQGGLKALLERKTPYLSEEQQKMGLYLSYTF